LAGVAETAIIFFTFFSNSSNLSGLLSNADGNLKPFPIRFSFLDLSQAYIHHICENVICDSSTKHKRSLGK
jgi:hypothetical protein